MLSFSSIQKTAHRLEDAFKFLQENDVEVDSKLESLFLNGFDTLQDLIVLLESPGGYEAERADKIAKAAEPRFVELQQYLESMQGEEPVSGSSAAAIDRHSHDGRGDEFRAIGTVFREPSPETDLHD